MSQQYFQDLCNEIIRATRSQGEMGIGTLAEKRLHAAIKRYVCPNEDFHEVGVAGTRYVSDVRIGDEIYEIQTGSFYPMKKKIAYYLEKTDCSVTVVHPIPAVRWMSWVEPDTMDISPRRKVAGKKAIDLLPELYCLSEHLQDPRLRFRILYLRYRISDCSTVGQTTAKKARTATSGSRFRSSTRSTFIPPTIFAVFFPPRSPRILPSRSFPP